MKNAYAGKRILVTGGTGYLGSSVIRALKSQACTVNLLQGDIRDSNIWVDVVREMDVIFHFAAQTSAYAANDNPADDVRVNVLPVAALLQECLKSGARPDIIFSGTVTQAGLTEHLPVNETVKDVPVTVYDIHKLTVESYLKHYTHQMGGRAVTLRLANLYGPGPDTRSFDRGILNKMAEKALRGQALTVYGDGNFIRDYIFIDDVVDAFVLAGTHMDVLKGNHYVIGSGTGHTVAEMAGMVAAEAGRRTGKSVAIENVPTPDSLSPIEFRNFIADPSAFKRLTGWQPNIDLAEGIRRTVMAIEQSLQKKMS